MKEYICFLYCKNIRFKVILEKFLINVIVLETIENILEDFEVILVSGKF